MQLLALPGFLAFFFVSLWVGVRLLAQWGRTRQLPELLLGLGVLGIGPVGFGLIMLAAAAGASDPQAPSLLAGLSAIAVGGGAAAKAIFNWKIYHPRSRLVAVIALGAIAGLVIAIGCDATATSSLTRGCDARSLKRSAGCCIRSGTDTVDTRPGVLHFGAIRTPARLPFVPTPSRTSTSVPLVFPSSECVSGCQPDIPPS